MSKAGNTELPDKFIIAETDSFVKIIKSPPFSALYGKIKDYIYPQLRHNPFFGANIKKLRGELGKFYRYRVGKYRLFYIIDLRKRIIFIVNLIHRKESYK